LFAGTKLARYGDVIAEKTGLGRIWIGLALLAFITSLPELVTGVSAAVLVKIPDLAVGTLLGSCLFNITILVILDVLNRKSPVLSEASPRHMISAGVGIVLIGTAGGSILAGERFSDLSLGWIGLPSFIILLLYLTGMWGIFKYERRQSRSIIHTAHQYSKDAERRVYLKFAMAAMAVIGAGIWLAFIGDDLATITGWGNTFIGSLFLAVSTSMPELVICIAAFRIGAVDLAVADVLGANMINIAKIFVVDLFYTQGSFLAEASGENLITAVTAITMSLVVIIGLKFRQKSKTFIVSSWYGPLLLALHTSGAYLLFTSSTGTG
jgi:cation:H+ antiporter